MSQLISKKYGHTKVNKLDWCLAITCCIFALCAVWISIGVSVFLAAEGSIAAMQIFIRGLSFQLAQGNEGFLVSLLTTILFYLSICYFVFGLVFLIKKGRKERIPGVVVEFIAMVGYLFYLAFAVEFFTGTYKSQLPLVWPVIIVIFAAILLCIAIVSIYLTLSNFNISLEKEEEEARPVEEAKEHKEAIIEEEPVIEDKKEEEAPKSEEKPVQEEKKEEDKEETEEEKGLRFFEEEPGEPEEPEELEKDVLDPEEEEEEKSANPYDSLGKRRKRVPFENKMKHSKKENKERYKEIVGALREYELNDRVSIPGETFSYKKERLVFLTFSGETFKVYFKLNPDDFRDSPIPVKDARGIRKYEDVPTCLVIKSNLASRRAVILAKKLVEERKIPLK